MRRSITSHYGRALTTLMSVLVVLVVPNGVTSAAPVGEYEIKGAMLLKLPAYVEWPGEQKGEVFRVGVLGEDPFGAALDDLAKQASTREMRFEIKRAGDLNGLGDVDIVYVTSSMAESLPAVLKELGDRAILTVSDIDQFSERGGMVTLRLVERRIRLAINKKIAEDAGLKISSKLLQLAEVVGEDGGGGAR